MVQLEAVAKASNKGRWSKEPEQKVRRKVTPYLVPTVSFSLSVVLVSFPVLGISLGIGLGNRPGNQPEDKAGKQSWEQGWE